MFGTTPTTILGGHLFEVTVFDGKVIMTSMRPPQNDKEAKFGIRGAMKMINKTGKNTTPYIVKRDEKVFNTMNKNETSQRTILGQFDKNQCKIITHGNVFEKHYASNLNTHHHFIKYTDDMTITHA